MFLFFNYDVYDTFFLNKIFIILFSNKIKCQIRFLVGNLVYLVGEHGEHGVFL